MKYRGIDYELEQVSPSKWRWKIYWKMDADPEISDREYRNQVDASLSCLNKINSELGGANDA